MRTLPYVLLLVACTSCMGTRSASLGGDQPREEAVREDDAEGAEPRDEATESVDDAGVLEPREDDDAESEPEPEEPEAVEPVQDGGGGSDASRGEADSGRAAEPRDAQVRDAGRDSGQYTNPICRVEPWHCN